MQVEPSKNPLSLPFSVNDSILISGEFLISMLAFSMIIPLIGFFLGSSVSLLSLILSIICALGITILMNKDRLIEVAIASIVGLLIIATCVFISSQIYDTLCDSNMYHKLATNALVNGWNPIQESYESWHEANEVFETPSYIWVDHYPKGIYCIAASLSCAFDTIEAGKAYTLIIMFAAAFLLGAILNRKLLSAFPSILVSVITVFNPITCVQMLTFYNDAFLMMSLLILLAGLTLFICKEECSSCFLPMFLITCGFILCSETKFTGFAYAGIFSLSFYLFCLIRTLICNIKPSGIIRLTALFIIVIPTSFAILGYSSYITNAMDHGNPFYPLMGNETVDIFADNEPTGFDEMNNIERLIYSLFGISQNKYHFASAVDPSFLKIPFTFSMDEFRDFTVPDMRIGGFGPLYGGILIVQIAVLALSLPSVFRSHKQFAISFICYAIPALFLLIAIADSWWARYSAYQYFFNAYASIFAFLALRDIKKRKVVLSAITGFFSLLLLSNTVGVFISNVNYSLYTDEMTETHLQNMKEAIGEGRKILVNVDESKPGMLYLLTENGIDFELVDDLDSNGEPIDFDWKINYLRYKVVDR